MRALLLAAFFAPLSLTAQVRQLRAIPDPAFDAGDLEITQPVLIKADRENRLYLADHGSLTLVRLSVNGRTADTIVREGEGPGEARGFSSHGWRGDTLWFFDNRLARFSFISPQGKFLRTNLYHNLCSTTLPWSLLAGGQCLESHNSRSPYANAGDPIPPTVILVTRTRPKAADTIATVLHLHGSMQFDGNDRKSFVPQPFQDDDLYGPFESGTAIYQVQRAAATSPRADSIAFRRWSSAAGWGAWKSLSYLPRTLDPVSIDSAAARMAERLKEGRQGWITLDSVRNRIYRPKFYPPVTALLSTSANELWLRLEDGRTQPGHAMWIVTDTQFREVARVDAPSELRIMDARGNYCWGYILDEDDLPHLVRYQLREAR